MWSSPTTSFSLTFRCINENLNRVLDRLEPLTVRVGSMEEQVVGVRRDVVELRAHFVRLEHRFDSLDSRIERRLDLTEA